MAKKKVYIGSVGPFLFDDTDDVNDVDSDFSGQKQRSLTTDSQILVEEAPSEDSHVLRKSEYAELSFAAYSELTISSGSITLSGNDKFKWHTVDTEGDAASDDLTAISGGAAGDILLLSPASTSRVVTVKKNASFIIEKDCIMDVSSDAIMLIYNGAVWFEIARCDVESVYKTVDISYDLGLGVSSPTGTKIGDYLGWAYTINDDSLFDVCLPNDWKSGTDVEVYVLWAIDEAYATGNGEVRWQLDWSAVPRDASEALDAPTHTGSDNSGDINIPATAKTLTSSLVETIAAANLSADDVLGIQFSRVAIGDGNNPTAEPTVLALQFKYISNISGEAI